MRNPFMIILRHEDRMCILYVHVITLYKVFDTVALTF